MVEQIRDLLARLLAPPSDVLAPGRLVLQQQDEVPGLLVVLGQKLAIALASLRLLLVAVVVAALHLDDEVVEYLADAGRAR